MWTKLRRTRGTAVNGNEPSKRRHIAFFQRRKQQHLSIYNNTSIDSNFVKNLEDELENKFERDDGNEAVNQSRSSFDETTTDGSATEDDYTRSTRSHESSSGGGMPAAELLSTRLSREPSDEDDATESESKWNSSASACNIWFCCTRN